MDEALDSFDAVNRARFEPDDPGGYYESFFQRANHPSEPRAFWIRYTTFSPRGRASEGIGELWAIWFDGVEGRHVVVKHELPLVRCSFARDAFSVAVGDARLDGHSLRGAIDDRGHSIKWDLGYSRDEEPLFLLPPALYRAPLPRAKLLVGAPNARFSGYLSIDGERVDVDGWRGSQNHNWGSRHTDRYAWGQVAGFDEDPSAFLEVASAQIKVGPLWMPTLTPIVLRLRGEEIRLRSVRQSLRAKGSFRCFEWSFSSSTPEISIEGEISAPKESFVGLRYANPPGGAKHCLNSKLARCTLRIRRPGVAEETLTTAHRAAFELLTDARDHGVAIRA